MAIVSAEQRFLAKIIRRTDGCWIWTGSRGWARWSSYGHFNPDGRRSGDRKIVRAHRFAYELYVGPIPPGVHVHHECGETLCVNPDHLALLTPSEHILVSKEARMHCRRGHPFSGDNFYVERSGARRCRTCRREGIQRRRLWPT